MANIAARSAAPELAQAHSVLVAGIGKSPVQSAAVAPVWP